MIVYDDIKKTDDMMNLTKLKLLQASFKDRTKNFGEYFIALCMGKDSFKSKHPLYLSERIRGCMDRFLPAVLNISKKDFDGLFDVFEKDLKDNVFVSSNQNQLLYDLHGQDLIIDKTKAIPMGLKEKISSMTIEEMLNSEDVFVVNAALLIIEQIAQLAMNYDVSKVLQDEEIVQYVRSDIKTNLFRSDPGIDPDKRGKLIKLVSKFGIDNYEKFLKNLNTLNAYVERLNPTVKVEQIKNEISLLRDNFDDWSADQVINSCQKLFKDYKEENARQLISSLMLVEDGSCINSQREGRILLTFVSRDDEYQKKKESQFATMSVNDESVVGDFLLKDAVERQINREKFVSFEVSSNYEKYKVNNSNNISVSYFDVNCIKPHLGRKVALGYGSTSLSPSSFSCVASTYLSIDNRDDFEKINIPYVDLVKPNTTNELILDATQIGAPTYVLYVQTTPDLDLNDPDYVWAMQMAKKHSLDFIVYNDFIMKHQNESIM